MGWEVKGNLQHLLGLQQPLGWFMVRPILAYPQFQTAPQLTHLPVTEAG